MIVAKTRMKKIPKTCKDCPLSIVQFDWGNLSHRICGINSKDCPQEKKPSGNYGYGKPCWCPLVEIEG